ncbi:MULTISPECIES: hypothetical protein [unclassified Pseudomonas]|uniref:hypothetical protein n=1 Tax=unclassified Pseudomonas TaxID=196821 RepID=UPI0030D7E935
MTRKHIFWFWGSMDAIYLARYVITSVMGGRIPYFSDVENAVWILREHSVAQIYMFVFVMLLQASIIVSCLLFFIQQESIKWLVYLQAPLRLAFLIPSVSLLLIGARLVPDYNLVLMVVLVVVSEMVKVWSVWRWSKKC